MFYVVSIIIFLFSFLYIYFLNREFFLCPNKEMLLWDANIRMIQALDVLQFIKEKQFLESIKILLDSPTWPPLRTIISIVLILFNGRPDPILDTRPSIFFFLLLFLSIILFVYKFYIKKSKDLLDQWIGYISIFLTISFLFLLKQIPEYLFNSMLEIQGMLFYFVFISYYIYINQNHLYSKRKTKILFFVLGALIYLTKYPYGVLISISLVVIEMIKNPKFFLTESLKIIKTYKNLRFVLIVMLFLSFGFILLYPYFFSSNLNKKAIKNLVYVSILIFYTEFNVYIYRKKLYFFSENLRFFYKFFIFPFSLLILIHPDRFFSLLGAQSDIIEKDRNFFTSLFFDYFYNHWVFSLFMTFSFLTVFYTIFKNRNQFTEYFKKSPILQILTLVWTHFFILEFTTTNHQARYIFQILPLLILFHSLIFIEIKNISFKIGIVFFLIIFIMSNFYFLYIYPPKTRNVCFAGRDSKLFEPVYLIQQEILPHTKAIIFNEFHEYKKDSQQLDNPYLFIPTDIDVHLRYKVFPNGFLINYQRNFKSLKEFKKIIYITHSCKNEIIESKYYKNFFKDTSSFIELVHYKEINPLLCLKIYSLK